jgi:hypothetical protein
VNGEVLGEAEDFMTPGPGRVCIGSTGTDIEQGETAYLHYAGIHWGGIKVTGPRGTFFVRTGAWANPRGRTYWSTDRRGHTIARGMSDGRLRYLIYAPGRLSGRERPSVLVDGDALGRSTARDAAILKRITIDRRGPEGCDRRFEYGWDFE